ncbi:MAG: hypothetical protein V3U13_01935 [Gemmatimonadota bacterium]|jgi:hypothetical protein
MKFHRACLAGFSAVVLAAGCGGDGGTGLNADFTLPDIAGTWEASEFKFTSKSNTAVSVDIVALGGDATLTVAGDGSYSLVSLVPGRAIDVVKGELSVEDGTIVVSESGGAGNRMVFQAGLSDNTLTMATGDAEFDFINNGNEEPANLQIVWKRATGTTVADLEGTWEASVFRFISLPVRADTVDVIADGGSLTVMISDDASYSVGIAEPDELPLLATGTVLIDEGRLILIGGLGPDGPQVFNFELAGDTLSLEGEGEFDFDADGVDDPAIVEAVLERQ